MFPHTTAENYVLYVLNKSTNLSISYFLSSFEAWGGKEHEEERE